MEILYILHSLEIGGAEKITVQTALEMNKRGHSVFVAGPPGPLVSVLENNNISFIKIAIDPNKKNIVSFFSLFFKIFSIVRKNKITLVHSIHRWPNFICYYIAWLANIKLVWTDHNILLGKRFFTKPADKIISVSHVGKRHLIEYFRLSEDRITVIHNGIKEFIPPGRTAVSDLLSELKVNNNCPLVCSVGRLAEQNGHEYLIKAIPRIRAFLSDVHFIFVGDGPLRLNLGELARTLNVYDYCHFLGVRDDISTILTASKIMVLPSLWEGLPLVILEAFSMSVPVIATKVGGNVELVKNEKTGYLVEPKDNQGLASAIIQLLLHEDKRQEMGRNAYREYQENYTFERMISNIERVYQSLAIN